MPAHARALGAKWLDSCAEARPARHDRHRDFFDECRPILGPRATISCFAAKAFTNVSSVVDGQEFHDGRFHHGPGFTLRSLLFGLSGFRGLPHGRVAEFALPETVLGVAVKNRVAKSLAPPLVFRFFFAWRSLRLEANAISEEKAKDEQRREAFRHPVFDRDAQDRLWQSELGDAAMAHAAKTAQAEQERAEREPRTMVETSIVKLLAIHNAPDAFVKALAAKQLMVARTTAEGIAQYRDDIHQRNLDADRAWRHASAQDPAISRPKLLREPALEPGELVIVNRWGGVHKLGEKRVDRDALGSPHRSWPGRDPGA